MADNTSPLNAKDLPERLPTELRLPSTESGEKQDAERDALSVARRRQTTPGRRSLFGH